MTTGRLGRLAVIGAGKMGETLISALIRAGEIAPGDVIATAGHQPRLDQLENTFGIATTLDNQEAVRGADLVFLCVKPQIAPKVLEELAVRPQSPGQLLISIIAGLTTTRIEGQLGGREIPVARAMPNTPSPHRLRHERHLRRQMGQARAARAGAGRSSPAWAAPWCSTKNTSTR